MSCAISCENIIIVIELINEEFDHAGVREYTGVGKVYNALFYSDIVGVKFVCLWSYDLTALSESIFIVIIIFYALGSKDSWELKTKLKKKLKTAGMTRGPTRHFQGNCREATQR